MKKSQKLCEGCGKGLSRHTKGDRCVKCRSLRPGYVNPFKGRKHSDATKSKMSSNHADVSGEKNRFWGNRHSENSKNEIRKYRINWWKTASEEQKKIAKDALMRGVKTMRSGAYTKPEQIVADVLYLEDVEFEHNAPLYGKFYVDFLLSDGTIIEVFGDYWHGNPKVFPKLTETQKKQQAKDRSRVAYLRKCGHKVVVFWEKELKENSLIVINRLYENARED